MEVTIGGNRVGSGKKMQAHLHNYYRSTHDLSEKFRSTMAPGLLYPVMVKPAMRGDTFDINIDADCRTIPTEAPLFGSFKLQVDVYQIPVRLYQGILHNNPLAIGLKMNEVKFPQLWLTINGAFDQQGKVCTSALLKYLGLSGIGKKYTNYTGSLTRFVNAIPLLAYYDIYKTYYANKQEEKGYIIGIDEDNTSYSSILESATFNGQTFVYDEDREIINITNTRLYSGDDLIISGQWLNKNVEISGEGLTGDDEWTGTIEEMARAGKIRVKYMDNWQIILNILDARNIKAVNITNGDGKPTYTNSIKEFDLKIIDDMRYDLLSQHTLGQAYKIAQGFTSTPYTDNLTDAVQTPLNGLALKTYQNDIFNNWLNTEWIEGDNGIKGITDIDVSDGTLSMDALNLSEKLYAMLNRVALAGNTYEDWQDVVYEETKRRQIESPIFCGGMSREVVFDEIVQSAPTEGNPLGTLGGRGRLSSSQKGGHITIKCDEACFIMAIASLTPRISYTQGNEFYMTELESLDDFHKPALDGIGFQDLIGERLAWWDTQLKADKTYGHRSKIGKLPAWIEYMTSYDKTYGQFAELNQAGYMVLTRNYEQGPLNEILDATTYVQPDKFNYAFADASLTAENFWMQINLDIKARRLMSARMIPNV